MSLYLQLLILLAFGVINGRFESHCNKTFGRLSASQSLFVGCAVHHSVPATVCVDCYQQHQDMITNYKELVADCSQFFISQNHLDLAFNMEHYLNEIWKKGFCDDCFDEPGVVSNNTKKFSEKKSSFESCLVKNVTIECSACIGDYLGLNDFYKEMEKRKKGKICFDMQDAMNRTRLKWSKDLKCCHRDINLTVFLVCSSLFCAIPLVFYFGMYGYTKVLERNHEVIDSTYGSSGQNNPSTSNATAVTRDTREAPAQSSSNKYVKLDPENIESPKNTDNEPSTS